MATNTTFDTLKQDIRQYLERGATLASDAVVFEQLPRLINLAERRIARELKIQGFINVATSTLVQGTSVYQKPDRWRETISINFGTGAANNIRKPLFTRGYEYLRSYWPDSTAQGEPAYYGEYDYSHWLIAPTPNANYPYEVIYYQLLPLLDDTNQTNWLTEYAPQVLLDACLLETVIFIKSDERIPVMQQQYDRSAAMLNGEDIAKILDRSAVRKEA